MLLHVLKSKIHRVTVTHADLDYEGSITLDRSLMESAGLVENELVHVWDVTNGNRIITYVMAPAESGSGIVCINGAAAHKVKKGDIVIIASFCHIEAHEAKNHKPIKLIAGSGNSIKTIKHV